MALVASLVAGACAGNPASDSLASAGPDASSVQPDGVDSNPESDQPPDENGTADTMLPKDPIGTLPTNDDSVAGDAAINDADAPADDSVDDDATSDDDATIVDAGTNADAPPDGDNPNAAAEPPVGDSPVVQVNHPGDGEMRDPCPSAFPFIGVAQDSEDGDLAPKLEWTSSLDGPLGTGPSFEACLSPGVHSISASVVDSNGNSGSASLSLTIGNGDGSGGSGSGRNGSGGSGSLSAADPASDAFERSALGSDWEVVFPANGSQVQIVDGSDLGMGPGAQGFFLVNWVGSDFAADQFCEATLPLDVDPNWLHQVYVRWRETDRARYGFGYDGDPAQTNFGEWIFKYDGVPSADTRIIAAAAAQTLPGPGDVLRIEIEGYTLRGYLNGDLVLEGTDTDPSRIDAGRPGLAARWATGNASTPVAVKAFESWSGGSL